MPNMKDVPVELIYGATAVGGGIARYLSSYINGGKFQFRYLLAGTVVAGFSGYMFALLGISLNMPDALIFIMAGSGGFMGDQAMKFIIEYVTKKVT